MNTETQICQNCKGAFTIESDDFGFYEKMKVPPPTFCPECRLIRRLAWRNEKSLYRDECGKCKNSIISLYSNESNTNVFCRPCWWGDGWDGCDYGQDIDLSKNILSQFNTLLHKAPIPSLFGLYASLVNSEYTNMVSDLKNCYMLTHSDFDENCSYGSILENCKDSMDDTMLYNGELCYEDVNCQKCYQTFYSVDSANCRNVYFCKNCVDCSDCFGCVNLRSKKYHIFNEPYSKEEYQEKIKDLKINSYQNIKDLKIKVYEFWKKFPQKYTHDRNNSNVSGDYIYNSKNTHDAFVVADVEDSKYCAFITGGGKTANTYDFTHFGIHTELIYDSLILGFGSNIRFCLFTTLQCTNMEYSMFCTGCKDCFLSVGLKKKQYCILNKQYSKEEYFKLREEIIKAMNKKPYVDKKGNIYKYGEFFPMEMSLFGYNATTNQEFFPLSKEQAVNMGYPWKDVDTRDYNIDILPEDLPDTIDLVDEDILEKVIGCEHRGLCNQACSTAFKITRDELQFYKRMNISLPHLCSNCRHYERNKFRNGIKFFDHQCMCENKNHQHGEEKCVVEFKTSYDPKNEEIIYCEKCYQAEVY
jgi:hypothetical protein